MMTRYPKIKSKQNSIFKSIKIFFLSFILILDNISIKKSTFVQFYPKLDLQIMKKILFALVLTISTSTFSQIEPSVTYDGGDLYFIPAKLTYNGIPFMYSYRSDYESGKTWFTIFDDNVNIVATAEIEGSTFNYNTRTITSQRKYFYPDPSGGTRGTSANEGYFLDEWTEISDITEEKTYYNRWIESPEVYDDNNSYHSRYMYISQTLFNEDEDFEFLRAHYEVMPLSYCATDDKPGNIVDVAHPSFGGEVCDEYTREYNHNLGGYIITMTKYKVYGGLKHTGTDIVSLDGTVKQSLKGITSFGTVVAINGNYYVSAYDNNSSKYGLYKIASATTSIDKVKDLTSETANQSTYSIYGFKVSPYTKGVIIRNGMKVINK